MYPDNILQNVDIVVYNLGYLPGGNKNIATTATSTVLSLEYMLGLLNVNGLVSITMYWGHPEGKQEREEVLRFVELLDSSIYHVAYMSFPNQKNTPPEMVFITRKK